MLGGEQSRQRVEVFLHQLQELHEHAGAPLRVHPSPGRLGFFGNGNRMLDLAVFGQRDPRLDLAGIGIEHVTEAPRSSFHVVAADEVTDLTHGSLLSWPLTALAGGRIVPVFRARVTHGGVASGHATV